MPPLKTENRNLYHKSQSTPTSTVTRVDDRPDGYRWHMYYVFAKSSIARQPDWVTPQIDFFTYWYVRIERLVFWMTAFSIVYVPKISDVHLSSKIKLKLLKITNAWYLSIKERFIVTFTSVVPRHARKTPTLLPPLPFLYIKQANKQNTNKD